MGSGSDAGAAALPRLRRHEGPGYGRHLLLLLPPRRDMAAARDGGGSGPGHFQLRAPSVSLSSATQEAIADAAETISSRGSNVFWGRGARQGSAGTWP